MTAEFDPESEKDCRDWMEIVSRIPEIGIFFGCDQKQEGYVLQQTFKLALAQARRIAEPCVWIQQHGMNLWRASCPQGKGRLLGQSPSARFMQFCPYCAHRIEEVPQKEGENG